MMHIVGFDDLVSRYTARDENFVLVLLASPLDSIARHAFRLLLLTPHSLDSHIPQGYQGEAHHQDWPGL
jgi:hypothetical protein